MAQTSADVELCVKKQQKITWSDIITIDITTIIIIEIRNSRPSSMDARIPTTAAIKPIIVIATIGTINPTTIVKATMTGGEAWTRMTLRLSRN